MRFLSVLLFLFIWSTSTWSQGEFTVPNPTQNIVPPSPTASALGEYGDVPVGHYTGVPNISIPLGGIEGKHLSVPISLNYHAAGFKVDEMAGWAGLGWSLNAGGVITRSMRGKEDADSWGYKTNPLFGDIDNGILDFFAHPDWVERMANGEADGEIDIYHFNFLGYSGKFVIDQSDKAHIIPHQDIKIESIAGDAGFIITTPDGNKFTFDETELTTSSSTCGGGSSPPSSTHNSAWYLTKIEHGNINDEINFTYKTEGTLSYVTGKSQTEYFDGLIGGICGTAPQDTDCDNNVIVNTKKLHTITSAYGKVQIESTTGRQDEGILKVDEILILGADQNTLLNKWVFNYDYFSSGSNPIDKRLKLISVQQLPGNTTNTTLKPPYTFNYLDEVSSNWELPSRLSFAQDHWGFYNGANSNQNLLPSGVLPDRNYNGANRDASTTHVMAGMLQKITYPTGGYTEFEFEANTVNVSQSGADILTASSSYVSQFAEAEATYSQGEVSNTDVFTLPHGVYVEFDISYENTANPIEWNGSVSLVNEEGEDFCTTGFNQAGIPCGLGSTIGSDPIVHYLPAGTYTLTATASAPGEKTKARLEWEEHVRTETVVPQGQLIEVPVGGVRIKRIKNFDGQQETVKRYSYQKHQALNESSGKLISYPKYAFSHKEFRKRIGGNDCADLECGFRALSSSSQAPLGSSQGSHVAYPEVTVFYGENGEAGKSEYTFTFEGDTGGSGYPYTEQTSYDWKRGHLKLQKDYEFGNSTPIHIVENFYDFRETESLNNNSIPSLKIGWRVIGDNCGIPSSWDCTTEDSQTVYYGNCDDGVYYVIGTTDFIHSNNGCEIIAYHPCFGQAGAIINNSNFENRFSYRTFETISQWIHLDKTIETTDGVAVTTEYEYDAIGRHTLPVKTKVTNSDGKKYETRMTYTPEAKAEGLPLASQIDARSMLHMLFRQELYVDDVLQKGVLTEYNDFSGKYLPKKYTELLFGGSSVERSIVSDYTADGYILGSKYMDFPEEVFTWENGRVKTKTYGDWVTTYNYWAVSRLVKDITDVDGQIVNFDYDGYQRLISNSARLGNISNAYDYQYGTTNSVTTTTTTSNAPEQMNTQIFDGLGRSVKTIVNGVVKNEIVYDNLGRVDKQTYLPGNFTELTYDNSPLNRVIQQLYPDGSSTQISFGNIGEYFSVIATDENGNTTTTQTDKIGRTYKVINALGDETTYAYDDRDNLLTVTPPDGGVGGIYSYAYDNRNRLVTKHIPGMIGDYTYTYYDETDLLKTTVDPNTTLIYNAYDQYGRPTDVRLNGQSGPLISSQRYDEGATSTPINQGKLTSASTWILDGDTPTTELVTSYVYDSYGRVQQSSSDNHLGGDDIITSAYNDLDWLENTNRVHMTANSSGVDISENHTYDVFGRKLTTTHQIDNGPVIQLCENSYNDRDQLIEKNIGGGLQSLDYRYNSRGWMTHLNQPLGFFGESNELQNLCTAPVFNNTTEFLTEDDIYNNTQISLQELLDQRFDPNFTIGDYDVCDNGCLPDCNGAFPDASALLNAIENKYVGSITDGVCTIDQLSNTTATGSSLYLITLCDGSSIYTFSTDWDPLLISGGYTLTTVLTNVGASSTYDLTLSDGTVHTVTHEELILMVINQEPFTIGTNTGCTDPCSAPNVPNCDASQQWEYIHNLKDDPIDPLDIDGQSLITRVVLCDGSEVYLLESELAGLPGSYNVLDAVRVDSPIFDVSTSIDGVDRNDLFYLQLYYNDATTAYGNYQNGNIGQMRWQVAGRDMQNYAFAYDELNRLKAAEYADLKVVNTGQIQSSSSNTFGVYGIAYDPVGNIKNLSRSGLYKAQDCWSSQPIDQLTYTYNGNRLNSINDGVGNIDHRALGFNPGNATGNYSYDDNGNMINDPYKDMSISYNFINLPNSFTKVGTPSGNINIVYDASGKKLRKTVSGGEAPCTIDYVSGIEYRDGVIEAIYHEEGRAMLTTSGDYRYEFSLKDHLGNSRLNFSDIDGDGSINPKEEVIQEAHYYPFGMQMEGPWTATAGQKNQYLYNGKELNEDFDLNWFDYGARWYDASIGRWNAVDPLAESYAPFSPYNYTLNNPILLIDPDGRSVTTTYENEKGDKVTVNDGVDKTIKVSDTDFALAQVYAGLINGDPDSKVTNGISQELADSYTDFYDKNNSYDGFSLANTVDYLFGGPDLDHLILPNKPLGSAGPLEYLSGGPGIIKVIQGSSKVRSLWSLTKEGASKIKRHSEFGKMFKSKSDGLWWAVDNAGHGGSKFKVFKESKKGLEWFKDADEFGDFIINKHKGSTGKLIPWGHLKTVK